MCVVWCVCVTTRGSSIKMHTLIPREAKETAAVKAKERVKLMEEENLLQLLHSTQDNRLHPLGSSSRSVLHIPNLQSMQPDSEEIEEAAEDGV